MRIPRSWRAPELSDLRCPRCDARLYLDRGAQWCPDCVQDALSGIRKEQR